MAEENVKVERDVNMNLKEMVNNTEESNQVQTPDLLRDMVHKNEGTSDPKPVEEVEETALQKAIRMKSVSGIVTTEEEETDGEGPLVSTFESEERQKDFENAIAEQQEIIEKEKYVVGIRKPENEKEHAELMNELSETKIVNGQAIVPEGAIYIAPRTKEVEEQIKDIKEREANGEPVAETQEQPEATGDARLENKQNIVRILIDKTGLGADIKFDEEEEKAIHESSAIHLVEVEDEDLKFVNFERLDESMPFLQAIDTYTPSVSKTPMTFPASGFKADMTGLNYVEFGDVTLDPREDSDDYLNFDLMNRRFNIVYNHMKNISIGNFASYEDFLKKFAYVDMNLAIYGLLISTQPEIDSVRLSCTKQGCGKSFDFKYSPRSIIDFDSASTKYLEAIKRISEAKPEDRLQIAKDSAVRKTRRFVLPGCKYIVDLSAGSCYDYLYGILGFIKSLEEKGGLDNPDNEPYYEKVSLLYSIHQIGVPQRSGNPIGIRKPEQIMELIVRTMPTSDVKILTALVNRYIAEFYVRFSLKDIQCPACKHVTKMIPITPDELVFLIQQRQMDTEIMFDNFQDF